MKLQRIGIIGLASSALLFTFGQKASAASISYEGNLFDSVTNSGSVSSNSDYSDPSTGQFWQFSGNTGDPVTLEVLRQEQDFDPSLWVFEGVFSDTSIFGASLDFSDPGFIEFADDEISNPGPFGDPQANLTLPNTGNYTAIVTNVASGSNDGGDGSFDYQITATGVSEPESVPEPTSILGLFAMGAIGFSTVSLRQKA